MNNIEIKAKKTLKLLAIPFACAVLCSTNYAGASSDPSGLADQSAANVAGTHAQQTVDASNLSNQFSEEELKNDESLLQDLQAGGVIPLQNSGVNIPASATSGNSGASSTTEEAAEEKPEPVDPKTNPDEFVRQYEKETLEIGRKLDKANLEGDTKGVEEFGPEYKKRMYTLDRIAKDLKSHVPDYNGPQGNFETIYTNHIKGNNYTSSTMQVLNDAPIDPDKAVLVSLGFPGADVIDGGSEDATDETSDTTDTGDENTDDGSTDEADPEAGIEAVCGGNFGGKNGAKAMIEKLQSAECQAALEADPAIKAEASVDQALAGLAKWQSVVNGSSKYFLTIQGIGIENLRKIGVNIWPNYTQAEVDINFEDASDAVKDQQDVKNQSAVGNEAAATQNGPAASTDKAGNFDAAN
ncbi:MAG: hypothetical protein KC646_05620 [Candidatus Cloacimonetes bacterium]|nr:hypothetical protein [Candidatus Cloacimonadota bacterium]